MLWKSVTDSQMADFRIGQVTSSGGRRQLGRLEQSRTLSQAPFVRHHGDEMTMKLSLDKGPDRSPTHLAGAKALPSQRQTGDSPNDQVARNGGLNVMKRRRPASSE